MSWTATLRDDRGHVEGDWRMTCPLIVCRLGGDHLYDTCPAFQREAARFGENARDCSLPGCDPLDESVCGWCRRVWVARHKERTT